MYTVKRSEWGWPIKFAALVMALTMAPYVVAELAQTPTLRFSGFLFGVEDGNSYIAKMNQGAHGAWLFTLPYSSEPQTGAFIYAFYLGLGKLAGPSHAMQVWVYHAARLLLGGGLLLTAYLLLAAFLPRVTQRRLGLVLVGLGGGLGWLIALSPWGKLFDSLPVDFISPEAFSFLNLYGLPHLSAARCLFWLGLWAWLKGRSVPAGLCWLGLSLIQPMYVLVAWAILAADVGLRFVWRQQTPVRVALGAVWRGLAAVLISAPVVGYTVWLFYGDPIFKQWGAQNILTAPHPVHYLLAYLPLLAVSGPGWRALAHRGRKPLARFVLGWLLLIPFLLYAPVATQRRLIEGVQLPLVVLAVLGITVVLRRWRSWVPALVLAFALPTTALLLAGGALTAWVVRPTPMFIAADEVRAFAWLAQTAQPRQVVLSAYATGNALPAYAPLVAYIGHGPETLWLDQKQPRVAEFYQAATAPEIRRALLADGRIAYVIFGPAERALGDFAPEQAADLELKVQYGEYAVYQVVSAPAP